MISLSARQQLLEKEAKRAAKNRKYNFCFVFFYISNISVIRVTEKLRKATAKIVKNAPLSGSKKCFKCKGFFHDDPKWRSCEKCDKWFCKKCLPKKLKSSDEFFCKKNCRN